MTKFWIYLILAIVFYIAGIFLCRYAPIIGIPVVLIGAVFTCLMKFYD